jgi:hypothetical protein
VADKNCVNNSQTVLKLSSANQANPDICAQLDLSRWVGYNATNLIVRVRMRLGGAGSDTVYINPMRQEYGTASAPRLTRHLGPGTRLLVPERTSPPPVTDWRFFSGAAPPLSADGIEIALP